MSIVGVLKPRWPSNNSHHHSNSNKNDNDNNNEPLLPKKGMLWFRGSAWRSLRLPAPQCGKKGKRGKARAWKDDEKLKYVTSDWEGKKVEVEEATRRLAKSQDEAPIRTHPQSPPLLSMSDERTS